MRTVPGATQADVSELGEYRSWSPEAQERVLELIEQRKAKPWRPFYCKMPSCNGKPHADWTWNHARADQRPPPWFADWLTWLISSGRGAGKTRTGSEVTHRATELYGRIILIAPTGPDLRDTMVEDPDSGIQATAPPGKMPEWEPSKKKLTWPNGAFALGFSAEEPDRLRGKQSGFIWADEPAHFPDPEAVWDMALFGHRVEGKRGAQPKALMTSTPKPLKWLKEHMADPKTVVTRVSSYANIDNLARSYKDNVLSKYQGTRLGKQELEGELLEDVEGALWNWNIFRWGQDHPALRRIVVAVDPAGSTSKRADMTGIIVIGISHDNVLYVLADYTAKLSPAGWADKVMMAYEFHRADAVVAEKNYGGEMVRNTLENSRLARELLPRILDVDSRRGKEIRAEPIVALYEKKRVVHVGPRGTLDSLEDEQTSWVPGSGPSPNRVDALVHGATELAGGSAPSEFATPADVSDDLRGPVDRTVESLGSGLWTPDQGPGLAAQLNPYRRGMGIPTPSIYRR